MKVQFSAMVLCALGMESVLAMPSANHHRHQLMHKRDTDWKQVIYPSDSSSAPAATTTTTTTTIVAPTTTAAASSSTSAASSASASVSTGSDGWTWAGFGGTTAPKDNGNNDEYVGNVGSPWGSNIQTVSDSVASSYKYTSLFKSTASDTIKIIIWNKSGPDGQPNSGQFSDPAVSFDLGPGDTQYVAFAENSQVAWCHFTGAKTAYGANDCTFGEADFGDLRNDAWSGYDVSSIQNSGGNNQPMTITCPNGETSSNTGNNYISDSQPGGIGGNLAPGSVRLTTSIG